MDTTTPEDWLTVDAAAKSLGVSPRRVRQLIDAGVIASVQLHPRLHLIRPSALDAARSRETRPGRKPKAD